MIDYIQGISSYNPDVIILQVGGNDIKNRNVDPMKLARDIFVFAIFIIECYDVKKCHYRPIVSPVFTKKSYKLK
jgi:lysophospholipase L1-like esterase